MNRRGATLIEMMTVLLVLGVLINIGMPAIAGLRTRADAVSVVGDLRAIRVAVLAYYADAGGYPSEDDWGAVPADLVAYLPNAFAFVSSRSPDVEYRWQVTDTQGQGQGQGQGRGRGQGQGQGQGQSASAPIVYIAVRDQTPDAEILRSLRSKFPAGEVGGSGNTMYLFID